MYTLERQFSIIHLFSPGLQRFCLTPADRLYKRNVNRLRAVLQTMITTRRSQETKSFKGDEQSDLLSILISTEFFKGNDAFVIDEMLTFFIAGMKTIQATTTNLICYLEMNPLCKARLMEEVLPVVQKAS
jgi:cytochrome P450